MNVVCGLTRHNTIPSAAHLQIEDQTNGYRVVDIGPGRVSYRRHVARSPWVHGEVVLDSLKEAVEMTLVVRVHASTQAILLNREAQLLRAFEQPTFDLDLTLDSTAEYQWRCYAAEVDTLDGGVWSAPMLRAYRKTYVFTIPRDVVPLKGPA